MINMTSKSSKTRRETNRPQHPTSILAPSRQPSITDHILPCVRRAVQTSMSRKYNVLDDAILHNIGASTTQYNVCVYVSTLLRRRRIDPHHSALLHPSTICKHIHIRIATMYISIGTLFARRSTETPFRIDPSYHYEYIDQPLSSTSVHWESYCSVYCRVAQYNETQKGVDEEVRQSDIERHNRSVDKGSYP